MNGEHMYEHFTASKYTNDVYDYEKNGTCISVVGRLKQNFSYWESMGCCPYILDVIQNGYLIPVNGTVESVILKNNKSSRE